MEKIFGRKTILINQEFTNFEHQEDDSDWEVISVSVSDSDSDPEVVGFPGWVYEPDKPVRHVLEMEEKQIPDIDHSLTTVIYDKSDVLILDPTHPPQITPHFNYNYDDNDEEEEEEEEQEGDLDDEDDDDLDDELVPWELSGRFGRERMRKLGKRSFAKMTKSKRLQNFYPRRGCVKGKHGLGLNCNYY